MAKNVLATFPLDDGEESFFGVKADAGFSQSHIDKIIKEVKEEGDVTEDEDDDAGEKTRLDDDKAKAKKAKAKPEDEGEGEDEGEEDVDFTFDDKEPSTKPKAKSDEEDEAEKKKREAAKRREEIEEDDDEEDDDDNKDKKEDGRAKDTAKPKAKAKADEEDDEGDRDVDEEELKLFTALAEDLKDRGFFKAVEVKKNAKFDEENFFEAVDGEVEGRVQETFEAFFEEMSDDGKRYLKFLRDGGNEVDYINHMRQPLDFSKFDENNKKHVANVLRYYITNVEQLEADELEDRIKYIQESGKERDYATRWNNKLKATHEKKVKAIEDAVKAKKAQEDADTLEFNKEIKEVLDKSDEINGIEIADKKKINDYITKPTVKVGKNRFVPQLFVDIQKVLAANTQKDKRKCILLAQILTNDFDFSDIVAEKETKTLKKAQSRVKEARVSGFKGGNLRTNGVKSLSDYID